MTIKLIQLSEERMLLQRVGSIDWEIDRLHRGLAALEKERGEIIDHCLRMGITEVDELRLVRRQGIAGEGPDAYRIERIEQE
jgi:hypothetical protein